MSNTYQAIFDAVRSKISNGDIGHAVEEALRNANISHYAEQAHLAIAQSAQDVANSSTRAHVLMRPRIYLDGNQWCALYGENVQDGVAGFGDSPEKAMAAFDAAWAGKQG